MNYVHAPLTSAHAQLISAPRVQGYDHTSELIKQEQLRGLQIRNNMASAPKTVQPPQQQKAQQAMPRSSSDLALLMSQRDLVDEKTRQMREQTRGMRLGNDLQETKNSYAPGEYEASSLERILGVKDKYDAQKSERDAVLESKLGHSKMLDDVARYQGQKRADVSMHPDYVETLQKLKSDVKKALAIKTTGGTQQEMNEEPASDSSWGLSTESIMKGKTEEEIQSSPVYDYDSVRANGGSAYGQNGVISNGGVSAPQSEESSFGGILDYLDYK